jgi:uncharacterized protein (TIGR00369 family)
MEAIALSETELVLKLPWRDEYANDAVAQALHGGVLSTVIDTAGSYLVYARSGSGGTTVSLNVDYLRPSGTTDLEVTARIVKYGRTLSSVTVEVLDGRRDLVAIGRCICLSS